MCEAFVASTTWLLSDVLTLCKGDFLTHLWQNALPQSVDKRRAQNSLKILHYMMTSRKRKERCLIT